MTSEIQVMTLIESQLLQLENHGLAIRSMFEGMKQIENNVTERFEEVKGMVQEVRDSVTLTDFESYTVREAAKHKSSELTKDRYKESDEKFTTVFGKHLRLIYSKLKRKFEVAKYSHIRRVDFPDAVNFINTFVLEDYL